MTLRIELVRAVPTAPDRPGVVQYGVVGDDRTHAIKLPASVSTSRPGAALDRAVVATIAGALLGQEIEFDEARWQRVFEAWRTEGAAA